MCLKRGPFTSDHEFVKTGHHILIIWAQEWAFLQGVCSLFSAFSPFGIKPGFLNSGLRLSEGLAGLVLGTYLCYTGKELF